MGGQPNALLTSLWKALSPTQYRPTPLDSPREEGGTAKARVVPTRDGYS